MYIFTPRMPGNWLVASSYGCHYFIFLCLIVPFSPVYAALAPTIDEHFEQVPLEQVFRQIHQKYEVHFSYAKKNVEGIVISAHIERQPLKDAMHILLRGQPLDFEIVSERFVLIMPQKEAQQAAPRICGWVRDAESNRPLAYANLRLEGTPYGTVSRADGSFFLQGFLPVDSPLTISYLGYDAQRLSFVQLSKGGCQDVRLVKQPTEVPGVVISEYLADGINRAGEAIVLAPRKVKSLPGLTEPDPMQLVQVLPGVNGPSGTAAGIHVRGGTPDQTLIRMNGIPMYQTGHFFDMIFAANPFAIDEAKVYRGGFSVAQPGRVSGVIDLSQGNTIPQSLEGGLSLNLTHAGADLRIPLDSGRLAILLSGRKSLTNVLPSITFNQLEERIFQATRIGYQSEIAADEEDDWIIEQAKEFSFSDWNAALLYHPHDKHRLSLSTFGGINQMNYQFIRPTERDAIIDRLRVSNYGVGLRWDFQGSNHYAHTYELSYSDYASYYDHIWESYPQEILEWELSRDNTLKDIRFQLDHRWQLNAKHRVQAGYNYVRQQSGYLIQYFFRWEDEAYEERFLEVGVTHSLYAGYTFTPNSKLRLELSGMIRSYNFSEDRLYVAPRFAATYQLAPHWQVRAHTGVYQQFVSQLIEWSGDEIEVGNQIWAISDGATIPVIESQHTGLGLTYDRKGWLLDVEIYQKYLNDLTSLTTAFQTNSQPDSVSFFRGEADILGLDFLLKKRWKYARLWLSYSLSENVYTFEGLSEEPFAASHDQRHVFSINQLVNWRQWDFGLGWTYRTGKPYTPRIADRLEFIFPDSNATAYEILAFPVMGDINSARLPAYHRLDFSAAYRFKWGKKGKLKGQVGLSILNLYNRRNILSVQYVSDVYYVEGMNDPPDPLVSEEVEKELLRITPNLMFRVSW